MRGVPLELGGTSRSLQFGLGAWAALEAAGYELGEVFQGFQGGAKRFTSLRALVWSMLQHEEPPPSLAVVGGWIDATNLVAAMEAVTKVLAEALPEPGNGGPPDPSPAARIGGPSGGSRRARSR
jgi:hypothetical protein